MPSGVVTGSVLEVPDITDTNIVSGTETESVTGSIIRYTYDAFNRMTGYDTDGVSARYSYNAEDYRIGKRVKDDKGIKNTHYFYEENRVIIETDGVGNITSHNLYGANLISRSTQEKSYYYLYNAHGDVVMLMNTATGTIAGTYRYDAFGNVIIRTGDTDNSITYAGYQYDEESGLYYLNVRYYDSSTARFLTEDTFRGNYQDPLSLNRYTYCHNNPMIYWDPTGHVAKKYVEDNFYSLTTGERYPRCKIGSAGSYVYQMEQMLEYAGYHPGDSNDGIFDGCTLSAVRLFQQDNGLKVTGIVEQKAWAYLEIQPQLKRLESSYNHGDIRKEEYEAQVGGLKRMANNVPYKYDDRTLEAAKRELYSRFYVGLVVEKSLLELQAMVLTMGTSEIMGDGADLLYDVSNAIVNPNPNAVGSIVYDSVCLLVPDGPLNYADNVVDDVADLGKRAGKSGSKTIHNDILDSPRTGSALKVDDVNPIYKINEKTGKPQIVKEFPATAQSHGFNDIVDNYAGYATKTPLNNATLYQLDGSLNGLAGRFEWIIQDGNVTHRMFIQNGTMNGVPIKP